MADKKPKRPRDPNQLAKRVVDIATGQSDETNEELRPMSVLGREGGKLGGVARARALSPERRAEIARAAAAARWDAENDRGNEPE